MVPTATTRPPFRRAPRQVSRTSGETSYRSWCIRWSSKSSTVTGRKVSSPTTSSRRSTRAPAARQRSNTSSVRCSPAVGAAAEAGRSLYTVWYRSGSASSVVRYGGSGISPWRSNAPSRSPSGVRTATCRRPSPRSAPISTARSSPATNSVPGGSRRLGRTSASHRTSVPDAPSSTGRRSRTSAAPPVGRRRRSRAGRTLVSLRTRTSPGPSNEGRSRTVRWTTEGPVASSSRAAGRSSSGSWAMADAGRS